jgi:hypothetical protein
MTVPDTDKRRGAYLGTEIDGKWWRRYRKEGFFCRGSGEWWIEEGHFCCRRWLTTEPLRIELDRVREIKIGTSHAGRWLCGRPVLKLLWEKDGRRLGSGFYMSKDRAAVEALRAELLERCPNATR